MRLTEPAQARAIVAPRIDGATVSLRLLERRSESVSATRGYEDVPELEFDRGAMLTVWIDGACAYAATADLSRDGLERSAHVAARNARIASAIGAIPAHAPARAQAHYRWRSQAARPICGHAQMRERVRAEESALRADSRIIHSHARLTLISEQVSLWLDGEPVAEQQFEFVWPMLEAVAADRGVEIWRTLGGRGNGVCLQGGLEMLERAGFTDGGRRVRAEAIELAQAPVCPQGRMSLMLAPDQMMLQVHESIGHPLELDRILGDERNFAGTSFVTPEMFGSYRYGSDLLNVRIDARDHSAVGSAACDDEGQAVVEGMLIERGLLLRPIGGGASCARLPEPQFGALGCARASGWQRAPIDRMPNVNIVPGEKSFEQLVASVEYGVLMRTNASWSIDDRRDKFQFACEWGRLIEHGRLGALVRHPGYRGRSAAFWRALVAVGDASTLEVQGTPFCGKGEPGQVVRVGHLAPACVFDGVEVFGTSA